MGDEYRLSAGFQYAKIARLEDLQSPQTWAEIPEVSAFVPIKVDYIPTHYNFSTQWRFDWMAVKDYAALCMTFYLPFRSPRFSNHVWHNILRRYERAQKHGRTFKQTVRLNAR